MFTATTFAEFVMKEPDGRWSQFKESNEIHYQEHWDECPRKQNWLLPLGAGQMNLNFTGQVRIALRCNQLSTIYRHKIAPVGPEWEAQMLFRQCIVLFRGHSTFPAMHTPVSLQHSPNTEEFLDARPPCHTQHVPPVKIPLADVFPETLASLAPWHRQAGTAHFPWRHGPVSSHG